MSILTSLLPECERVVDLNDFQFQDLQNRLASEVDELFRLANLDADLDREKHEMRELQVGLRRAKTSSRPHIGPLWLRRRLIAACEEEGGVDHRRIDEEFALESRVVGLPKHGPARAAGLQPQALAPVFQAVYGGGHQAYAPHPHGQLAFHGQQRGYPRGGRGQGAAGHYGPPAGGGGRGGRGRGSGPRRPPICGKCSRANLPDTQHSYTVCPFTICTACKKAGHARQICPG